MNPLIIERTIQINTYKDKMQLTTKSAVFGGCWNTNKDTKIQLKNHIISINSLIVYVQSFIDSSKMIDLNNLVQQEKYKFWRNSKIIINISWMCFFNFLAVINQWIDSVTFSWNLYLIWNMFDEWKWPKNPKMTENSNQIVLRIILSVDHLTNEKLTYGL